MGPGGSLLDAQVSETEAAAVAMEDGRGSSRDHAGEGGAAGGERTDNGHSDDSNRSALESVKSGEYGDGAPRERASGAAGAPAARAPCWMARRPTVGPTVTPTATCSVNPVPGSGRDSSSMLASFPEYEAPGVHTLQVQVVWRKGKALGAPCPLLPLPDAVKQVGTEWAAMQPPAAAVAPAQPPVEQQQHHVGLRQPAASVAGEADNETQVAYRALITDPGMWLEITRRCW